MCSNRCEYCDEEIKKGNKFCNKSCAAKHNNKKYPKRSRETIKYCPECGDEILNNQRTYCSNECFQLYKFKTKTLPKFYKGELVKNTSLKKVLIYLFGDICVECGCGGEWNGKPLILQVDHIDGNSDNNLPENVRLLCPNCHTQTDTYCGSNVGNYKNDKRNEYLREYRNKLKEDSVTG